jgi:hypothetical protein
MVSCRTLGMLFALLLLPAVAGTTPLGRSFTYQGQLSQAGSPVNGTVHLRFSLWDAAGTGDPPAGGNQVGSSQIRMDVPISQGVFSVEVNTGGEFGNQAFNGEARWLQVEVCTDGTCASSTVLGPRQLMTAAPYALGPWQLSGTSISYSGGNVGIGTASPVASLHIRTPDEGLKIEGSSVGNPNSAWIGFADATGTDLGYVGDGSSTDAHMYLASYNNDVIVYTAAGGTITAKASGRVGVGTQSPTEKLEVRGNIKMGTAGDYYASSGHENFRIVRGTVASNAVITEGSGFTVTWNSAGTYLITFSPAFPTNERPSVTVAATGSAGAPRFAMLLGPVSNTQAFVRVMNTSGTALDTAFDFIAVGKR